MMRLRWLVVASAVVGLGCVKSERAYQLEHAKALTPQQLQTQQVATKATVPTLAPQPPRVFTIRAWVDLDYQAQVLHWNERVSLQVARASEITKATLNVELKLVAIETWQHRSERATLESHLLSLEKEDRANDVDLAIGFVSSLEIFTESQEQLGLARLQGRHAILRAMDNAAEQQAITRVFTKLDENERAALYRERKLHKELTLLLHEWGHILGAPHDTEGDSLLNRTYGIQRTRFSPMTAHLLVRALELREQKVDRKTYAQNLYDFVRDAPDDAWNLQDKAAELVTLQKVISGADDDSVVLLQQRDRAVYLEVNRLRAQEKWAEALVAIRPLVERDDASSAALSLACQLSGMTSLSSKETLERCRLAAAHPQAEASALLMLSQAQGASKDLTGARATFVSARAKFLEAPTLAVENSAALGSVARALNFVTWAEQASGRAMGRAAADEVVEWAAKKRRWFGLPAGAASPAPEAEPAYLERFVQAQQELDRSQLGKASSSIAALEKEFPSLPGPSTLRCELLLRTNARAKAVAACGAALSAFPESLQAHYLLGVMHSMAGEHQKAVEHLEAVVSGDQTVEDAWQRLGTAYSALGDRVNRERVLKRSPR